MCGRLTLFEADKILSQEFGVSGFPYPDSLTPLLVPFLPEEMLAYPAALGSTLPPPTTRDA